jgi:hypothetical protein
MGVARLRAGCWACPHRYPSIVGYTGELARLRDGAKPLDRRLLALDEILRGFHPFGFTGTLSRLRVAIGLGPDEAWAPADLLRAADVIDDAYRSWAAFRDVSIAQRRNAKSTGHPPRDSRWWPPMSQWLADYAASPRGETWRARDLGNCPACGHTWFSHAGIGGCTACEAEDPFSPDQSGVDRQPRIRCHRAIPELH